MVKKTNNRKLINFVIKNSSSLDFLYPLAWKACDDVQFELVSIYLNFNKSQLVENLECLEKQYGFKIYDLLDFCNFPVEITRVIRLALNITNKPSVKWVYSLNVLMRAVLTRYLAFFSTRLKKFLSEKDIVSFSIDARENSEFPLKTQIFRTLELSSKQVFFLPHAPHYIDRGKDENVGWMGLDNVLPRNNLRYVSPFLHKTTDRYVFAPNESILIGYLGFDDDWLHFLREKASAQKCQRKYKNITILLRKTFSGPKTRHVDPFTLCESDQREFLDDIFSILADISQLELTVTLKPHPSLNKSEVNNLISQLNVCYPGIPILQNREPMFLIGCNADIVISNFSTSLLTPAAIGVPVILVNTPLLKHVFDSWPILEEIYEAATHICNSNKLSELLTALLLNSHPDQEASELSRKRNVREFLRYWPNKPITQFLSLLKSD